MNSNTAFDWLNGTCEINPPEQALPDPPIVEKDDKQMEFSWETPKSES